MSSTKAQLAIFDTFKTKNGLTGEANRQRSIILILAGNRNPAERTRTGISQLIGREHRVAWKNIYSGVFRDLDDVLIPNGLAEEHGRLPLKRGPKALQERGIPYYHLTKKGFLVALSIGGTREMGMLLDKFFAIAEPREKEFERMIRILQESSPNFTYSIFQKYVKSFCDGKFADLLPFDFAKLGNVSDESLLIQKEIFQTFVNMSKQDRNGVMRLLDKMAPQPDAKH